MNDFWKIFNFFQEIPNRFFFDMHFGEIVLSCIEFLHLFNNGAKKYDFLIVIMR